MICLEGLTSHLEEGTGPNDTREEPASKVGALFAHLLHVAPSTMGRAQGYLTLVPITRICGPLCLI